MNEITTDAAPNPNWPLVAELQPQLRQHIRTFPQEYRGQPWYVLHDQSNGRHLRFSAQAYEFIGRLDGRLSVETVLARANAVLDDEALSQEEAMLILTQLFAIDVLKSGLPVDAADFFKRYQQERRLRRNNALMSPLAIRIRLLDPNPILNRFMPRVRPLFSRIGAIILCFVVSIALLLTCTNFSALKAAVSGDILAPANLLSLALVFIVIKTMHEFAHAFAVKMWGGDVHEMGITLLVFTPVPYVDASAAWGFRDKYKRILVGAIGILAELFIASIALFVWLMVEPGLIQDVALNAFLIASVSTVLFNANPLLRFDGYYVLQDWAEIPNLYSRASRYYLYLIQRYLFGLSHAQSPASARGEAAWFAIYGLGSLCYRLFILTVIVLFLAQHYLFIGVALGVWAVTMQIVRPLLRGLHFLSTSPALAGRRLRATVVSILLTGATGIALFLPPVTLTTQAEGIVWVSDQAQVYSGAEGFVVKVLAQSGSQVEAGTPVIQMNAPSLDAHIAKVEARHRELEIRSTAEQFARRVQSQIINEELVAVKLELSLLREQQASLLVHTQVAGTFVIVEQDTLSGRYLRQGALIGYVLKPDSLMVRAVVPQSDIGIIRRGVERVEIRFAEHLNKTVKARILTSTPAGSTALPGRALGAAGGGKIAVTLSDQSELTATEKVFQVDLTLPAGLDISGVGERTYVRFEHGSEPLGRQWLRRGRQLLLSRLSF